MIRLLFNYVCCSTEAKYAGILKIKINLVYLLLNVVMAELKWKPFVYVSLLILGNVSKMTMWFTEKINVFKIVVHHILLLIKVMNIYSFMCYHYFI